MAKINPFRFSTKYRDDETDLVYYGYRYYNASTGRWLSRDPIGQEGGPNFNGFVGNCPLSLFDTLGMYAFTFEKGMGTKERQDLANKLQKAIDDRLPSLIQRINNAIKDSPFVSGCCEHDEYEKDLKFILNILTQIQIGVKSATTVHLASNDHLQNGKDAYAETLGPSFLTYGKITTIFQDKMGPTRFWDLSFEEQQKNLFHEMSHYYRTDDNSDYIPNEGDTYSLLYSNDENERQAVVTKLQGRAKVHCNDLKKKNAQQRK